MPLLNRRSLDRYDPYSKKFTVETFDFAMMKSIRHQSIVQATKAKSFGIILGSLGRQGNPKVLDYLAERLRQLRIPYTVVLLSEIFPSKLALFHDIDA